MDHKHNLTHKKTLSNFFHEEKDSTHNNKNDDDLLQSPSFHHLSLQFHENLSPNHHGSSPYLNPESLPLIPQSPESIWSHSPLWTPSHPSLLYCCISSLHRDGDIYSIAVSGDLVLTGSSSRRVHAWQPLDCHAKGYIHASSGEVRAMVAHGEMLFTSHKDNKIRVWNMRNCSNNFRPRKIITLPNSASNFKIFISRPITPQPRVTSKPIITPQHKDIISCMAYYHVEGILYTGSYDKTVKAWRLNEKKCVDSFISHGKNVNDMVVNQQNGYLFTCSSDGTVKMWLRVYGENSHALIKVLCFHTYPIYALALSMSSPSQSSILYSGSSDGSINFWEQELSCRYNHGGFIQGHRFAVLCLVTLENLLISGSEDSTIRIWRKEKGKSKHECLAILEGHRGPVRCLSAYLQKDKFAMSFLVYSASLDQTFKVWRVKLLSAEMKKCCAFGDDEMEDNLKMSLEFEKSPVLSPSWVKKKLQCRSLNKYV